MHVVDKGRGPDASERVGDCAEPSEKVHLVNDDITSPWSGDEVRDEGLVLRPWTLRDVPRMVKLFDTAEMDRWTPLAHPFDEVAATSYVNDAHQGLSRGVLQLAVTESGGEPLGEVLLFGTDEDGTCEFASAVGCKHRGKTLGARSVRAVLPVARAAGYRRARLRVAVDNLPSQRVAAAAGFTLTDEPLQRRERKGYLLHMATWRREKL
jgi:RimJ/RimL family protein N-acetyltransferase